MRRSKQLWPGVECSGCGRYCQSRAMLNGEPVCRECLESCRANGCWPGREEEAEGEFDNAVEAIEDSRA